MEQNFAPEEIAVLTAIFMYLDHTFLPLLRVLRVREIKIMVKIAVKKKRVRIQFLDISKLGATRSPDNPPSLYKI
jgi:hypothetical protein